MKIRKGPKSRKTSNGWDSSKRKSALRKIKQKVESSRKWSVHLTLDSRKLRIPVSRLKSLVTIVLGYLEGDIEISTIHEVHVSITDDESIRVMNREYRGKDKPTDVLSFPQFEPEQIRGERKVPAGSGSYLGDLVISTETTLRQAEKFEVTVEEEVIRLVVHGLLHLCGYDHERVPLNEAARMRRRERKIRALVADMLQGRQVTTRGLE